MKKKFMNLAKKVYKAIKENIKDFAKLAYGIIFAGGLYYWGKIYRECIQPATLPTYEKVLAASTLAGICVAAFFWFFDHMHEREDELNGYYTAKINFLGQSYRVKRFFKERDYLETEQELFIIEATLKEIAEIEKKKSGE